MINVAISTVDNPFDPFEEYEEWRRFDEEKGYYSNQLLDRVMSVSSDLPDEFAEELTELAIDAIIQMEQSCALDRDERLGVHMKVRRKQTAQAEGEREEESFNEGGKQDEANQ